MTLEERSFPLDTQIGHFENEQDVEKWLLEQKEPDYPHEYGHLIKATQVIYSPKIEEYLIRYKMQKAYNMYSYSQNFDEVPAEWIDLLNWMDICTDEALKEKQRLA